jgi:uncharacterized protein YggE
MNLNRKGWQMAVVVLAIAIVGWLGFDKGGGGVAKAEPLAAGTTAAAALNTITVGANGSIKVEPDIAYVNLAVETRGASASAAQQANANKFAAVEKALYEKFAIDKKDVQTTGFFVQPEYNYTDKEGRKLTGYLSVHAIQVNYRKLTEIGKLLDALSAAGANRMDGVQFATEKTDEYELQALQKAMVNAEAKAKVLAGSAKRQLLGVVNIVQGAATSPPIMYRAEAKIMADSAGSSASSVQTGQIEITTSVTVQYEMK